MVVKYYPSGTVAEQYSFNGTQVVPYMSKKDGNSNETSEQRRSQDAS